MIWGLVVVVVSGWCLAFGLARVSRDADDRARRMFAGSNQPISKDRP